LQSPGTQHDESETSPAEEQHPALAGEPQVEVAQRTTASATVDQDAEPIEPSDYFEHTLVLGGGHFAGDHPCHVDNARGVLEAAIQRGLHPKDDVLLVNLEFEEPDRRNRYTLSTHATYQVLVVPAVIDDPEDNALTTVTPSTLNESLTPDPGE
jgi:hypothetical protein